MDHLVVAQLGPGWVLERRLPGGSQGALLVRRPEGPLAVVRLGSGDDLARETQRVAHVRALREAGYPTPDEDEPRLLADGRLALITDHVADAEPVSALTEALVDDLVALMDVQQGLAPAAQGWGAWLARSLSHGFHGWSRPAVLRADPRCASLARRACAHVEGARAVPEARGLLHTDLHQSNVLVRRGRVVAVIDCGGVRTGDRWFDLVTAMTIAATGPVAVREQLRRVVEEHVPPAVLSVYTAHHGVRLLDWALTYAPDLADFWVGAMTEEFDRYGI